MRSKRGSEQESVLRAAAASCIPVHASSSKAAVAFFESGIGRLNDGLAKDRVREHDALFKSCGVLEFRIPRINTSLNITSPEVCLRVKSKMITRTSKENKSILDEKDSAGRLPQGVAILSQRRGWSQPERSWACQQSPPVNLGLCLVRRVAKPVSFCCLKNETLLPHMPMPQQLVHRACRSAVSRWALCAGSAGRMPQKPTRLSRIDRATSDNRNTSKNEKCVPRMAWGVRGVEMFVNAIPERRLVAMSEETPAEGPVTSRRAVYQCRSGMNNLFPQ